jgi:hypothetical protein
MRTALDSQDRTLSVEFPEPDVHLRTPRTGHVGKKIGQDNENIKTQIQGSGGKRAGERMLGQGRRDRKAWAE